MVDALLAVAQREIGVGAEAEGRGRVVLQIIVHIQHAGLLVSAEQRADRIAQRHAALPEILERIETEDARPLVVHHAAADDIAVLFPHGKGVLRPAVADRNHVEVRDRGEILAIPLADLRIADIVFTVDSVKSELTGNRQPLVERSRRAFAEGLAWQRLFLHTVDCDDTRNIVKNILFILRDKGVDIAAKLLSHRGASLFVSRQ